MVLRCDFPRTGRYECPILIVVGQSTLAHRVQRVLLWLDSWPAGLKLNTELSKFYANGFMGLIAQWTSGLCILLLGHTWLTAAPYRTASLWTLFPACDQLPRGDHQPTWHDNDAIVVPGFSQCAYCSPPCVLPGFVDDLPTYPDAHRLIVESISRCDAPS
jgi:hypothetical protein